MKILMIAPEPFFEPRGTPISVYQRLEALSSLGHEIDLLTYHVGKDVNIPNVQIYRNPHLNFIKRVEIGPSWGKLFLDGLLIIKSFWMLSLNKYDVIHSHEEAAFFSGLLGNIFQTKHLYDMHSVLSRQLEASKFGNWWLPVKLFQLLERYIIKTCDAIITVGYDLEEYVCKVNPLAKQVTIDNLALHEYKMPVDPRLIANIKKRFECNRKVPIVYTGTFEHYQGLELFIESAKIVQEQYPTADFLLVGAKPTQLQIWQEKVKSQHSEDYISIVEIVSPEEASIYQAYAHILVSPRLQGTTIPLKLYSYLHAGKPIVATDIEAHRQVLNEDIAILVQPNKEAFASGLLEILRNPELGHNLSERAQKIATEKYNYLDYQKKVELIYNSLFSNHPALVEEG